MAGSMVYKKKCVQVGTKPFLVMFITLLVLNCLEFILPHNFQGLYWDPLKK